MKRQGRLESAPSFLREYNGKNVVRGYARFFGVDLACALRELEMLDVPIDPDYATRLRTTLEAHERLGRERAKERHMQRAEDHERADWAFVELDFDLLPEMLF